MKRFLLFLLIGAVLISCNEKENDAPLNVEYSIGCTDCEVIYQISGGEQKTEFNKNSDWTYSFSGKKGDVLLLLAYNTGDVPQGVTARIRLNDEVLEERTTYCPISGYSMVVDTLE